MLRQTTMSLNIYNMISIEHFARLAKDFQWVGIKITPKISFIPIQLGLENGVSKAMSNHMLSEIPRLLKTKTVAGNNNNNSHISCTYTILSY